MNAEPSTGLCYSCRHISPTVTHCYGTGDLEPSSDRFHSWPGFVCSCPCRGETVTGVIVLPRDESSNEEGGSVGS